MIYAIKSRLEEAARQQRRLRFWRTFAAWFFGAALAGFALRALPPGGPLLVWFAVPLLLAGLGWLITVLRQRTPTDLHHLARELEARYPELEGRLLTSIQLDPAERGLNYLELRVAQETLRHARQADWSLVVPPRQLQFAQWAGLASVALLLAALWTLRPGPAATREVVRSAVSEPSIEPGDVTLERGSSLIVLARFPERDLPAGVEVVLNPGESEPRRISLAKTLNDPVFGGSIASVECNFTYQVEYASRRSREFKVTVFEHPRLERANVDVDYPAYTGLPQKRIENTKRVSAVEGSRLRLEFLLNKPVQSGQLVALGTDAEPLTLELGSNQPPAAFSSLVLTTNRTYELRLIDADGRTNKNPERLVVEALPNRPPELRLTAPKGDVRPSPLEEVPFAGTVWDDFGVEAYGIAYAMAGRELQFVELGGRVPNPEKRTFEYLLRLEDLQLAPDQLVSYFVWADDIGPEGERRRSTGDLFFAEVRPFEELFREATGGMEAGASGQEGQGGEQGGPADRLAETQKQIINATWNLQRARGLAPQIRSAPTPETPAESEPQSRALPQALPAGLPDLRWAPTQPVFGQVRRGPDGRGGPSTSGVSQVRDFGNDLGTVREAQEQLLSQARQALERTEDPRVSTLLREVVHAMTRAQTALEAAGKSPEQLGDALAAQQAAYEAILKLQEHEYQVGRQQRGNAGQAGSARQRQMQMQQDQMDLAQSENRYETQRQAERPRTSEQKENLLTMNRLEELARRQQDLNQQFRDLQLELQQAQTEAARAEALRRLKKLQEEQQELLNDLDELRQRMDRPENQSRMAEQRQQLEQTRQEVQRAADAASQGSPSQALAAGTRAQRQMQDLRDELRQANSSQFAEDLREMRNAARELSRGQEDLLQRMDQEQQPQRRTLAPGPEREDLLRRLAEQRQQLTNLVSQALEISQDAETSEPLLAREMYDAVRQFSQETSREVQDAQNQLLNRGMMTRGLLDQLRDPSVEPGAKLLDIATEMLKQDFAPPAREAVQRARPGIENFRKGIEQAADRVLGSDTEALRFAEQELDALSRQLEREAAAGQGTGSQTNLLAGTAPGGAGTNGAPEVDLDALSTPGETAEAGERANSNESGNPSGERTEVAGNEPRGSTAPSETPGSPGAQNQGGEGNAQRRSPSERTGGLTSLSSSAGGGGEGGDLSGSLRRSLDAFLENRAALAGPLTGEDFAAWSERLRDVEDMIEDPALRNEVAAARERAREMRQAYKRELRKPDWAVVRLQLIEPLAEVRRSILEELARRDPRETLAPIDRDPVPTRYSDLVKRYYENLGKGTSESR